MSFWSSIKNFGRKITNYIGESLNSATGKGEMSDQAFSSAEAQKERDWQTEMSNTAHQREVADLQAAGLNPVLSAGGSGASSSSGASASSTGSSSAGAIGQVISSIANVIHSASSLVNTKNNANRQTTQQIYNSAGSLMKTVETLSRNA